MDSAKKTTKPKNPAGRYGLPVSLHPLSFDEVMAGLAQTKPPDKEKPKAKPAKGK